MRCRRLLRSMTDTNDERDLSILDAYLAGASKASIMRQHNVSRYYLDKLLKEALDETE